MIEIRMCTPEDAVAVSYLLEQLGYVVEPQAAADRIRQLRETADDPIFLAMEMGRCLECSLCTCPKCCSTRRR
jgi:hypothetical protein